MFRLVSSLIVVVGLWTLAWTPLILSEGSAAEVQEQALGDPGAPVTIIEYASLTCPHCAAFHTDVLPDLKERFIATGKVRLVYRDFPLDQSALAASVVAHCGGTDRFFSYIDVLMRDQARWSRASDPRAALVSVGKLGGLSEGEIDACFEDKELVDSILQGRLDAQSAYDINSTPSFVINGEKYTGNRDIDAFATIIDGLAPDA